MSVNDFGKKLDDRKRTKGKEEDYYVSCITSVSGNKFLIETLRSCYRKVNGIPCL